MTSVLWYGIKQKIPTRSEGLPEPPVCMSKRFVTIKGGAYCPNRRGRPVKCVDMAMTTSGASNSYARRRPRGSHSPRSANSSTSPHLTIAAVFESSLGTGSRRSTQRSSNFAKPERPSPAWPPLVRRETMVHAQSSAPLMVRPGPSVLRLVYAVQKQLWRLLRPRTRGVKVMLFNAKNELLLIRNSYGRSDLFVLPGGGVRPFESPEAAARREVHEELGCGVEGLRPIATFASAAEGKRDTIFLFEAQAIGEPQADKSEVVECRYVRIDALPDTVSPATLRRIAEFRGMASRPAVW
jgi:ADP-ribose pyrophosphatase YjhB (NUDIX family)